jgi:hypothetical protein
MMKSGALLIAAVLSISACVTCQADELVRRNIAQSIPAEVVFCARLDLNAARKAEQAESIVDAAKQHFKKQIDAIEEFSSLGIGDVGCIWVNVVKDKETLLVLEGRFNAEAILNSPVVTNSKRLVRPGTVIAIETEDEKTGEPSHAVVVNENVIALGLPQLVDAFVLNYVSGQSGWGENGQAVMKSLAASDAMLLVALARLPAEATQQKPFLAVVVNAQAELNVHERVTATARIAMQDEGKATALRDLISGFVGLGLTSEIKLDYPDIKKAIVDELKLGTEGKTVTLSSAMDTELLRKFLRAKGLELN